MKPIFSLINAITALKAKTKFTKFKLDSYNRHIAYILFSSTKLYFSIIFSTYYLEPVWIRKC